MPVEFDSEGGYRWNGPGPNPFAPVEPPPQKPVQSCVRISTVYGSGWGYRADSIEDVIRNSPSGTVALNPIDRGSLLRIAKATETMVDWQARILNELKELTREIKRLGRSFCDPNMPEPSQEVLRKPARELIFTHRVLKCFRRLGIETLGDLVKHTADELLEAKNFGMTSLNEVREKLAEHGLYLHGETPPAER